MKDPIKVILMLYILLKEFVIEVYAPGIKEKITDGYKGMEYRGYYEITAYEGSKISCGRWADGRTAMNLPARPGVIAVDPKEIRLGSIVYIEKLGYFIAVDTGKKIKGKIIDVYFRSIRECKRFGRRRLRVWVVKL